MGGEVEAEPPDGLDHRFVGGLALPLPDQPAPHGRPARRLRDNPPHGSGPRPAAGRPTITVEEGVARYATWPTKTPEALPAWLTAKSAATTS
ncbi:hypothetical protein GCM10014715_83100 [Streptomyces spiralis]|uniref:Uncharacterized protein n=1 Tax=Streptomyces spiralis TaxID=66376 RepID=A0A919E590_9ACTN|nr:hypothetical protein GCM10014715_83100 [Streptomyces spiralis]